MLPVRERWGVFFLLPLKRPLSLGASYVTLQKGELLEVDEETANILKNSRFAQGFLFQPIAEKPPASGACPVLEAKVCLALSSLS